MKVRTAVARCLAQTGTDTVFGVLGRGNMFLVRDLVDEHGFRYVSAAREDGAVLMGHGYAHTTGRLGVSTVTSGPGLTNAITAITEATRGRTPMIVLTGELPAAAPADAIQAAQGIDQARLIDPTDAVYRRVRSAVSAADDTSEAIRTALLQQRVVVLAVPSDLREGETENSRPWIAPRPLPTEPEASVLDEAVGIMASANRPVLLAGWGAVVSGARDDLLAVARRLGAPVATTLMAHGLFNGEPHDLGVFGTFASEAASHTIRAADCVVAFGASLNWHTIAGGSLVDGKRIVQCDTDPLAIGRSCAVTAGIVGDAGATARAILRMLGEFEPGGMPPSIASATVVAVDSVASERGDTDGSGTVDPRAVLRRLDEALPPDRVLVTDGGRFLLYTLEVMRATHPRGFICPLGFHAVGSGLATAVGAGIAQPSRTVVCVTGDGGLMMSLAELNTAVQNNVDLVVFVMNDGAYGQEIHLFEAAGMEPDLALLRWPDFAPVAEAFGATGVTVRCPEDIEHAADAIFRRDRPVLVDVKVAPGVA